MEHTWKQIISWLEVHAQDTLKSLRAGATLSQIEDLESYLSIKFPDSVRESYLMFDGQNNDGMPFFPDFYFWLPLDEIRDNWSRWKRLEEKISFAEFQPDADSAIQSRGWDPKWISITQNLTGDSHCLDFMPTSQGHNGQIIEFFHDNPVLHLVAPSFQVWLDKYANDLENNVYMYDTDADVIVKNNK